MHPGVEAFFADLQPGPLGRRFCLWHAPATAPQALFVHVHPFADEMNKSRRMAALQARALAQAGHAVLQVDLLGCGDSAGEFSDATWRDWVEDIKAAANMAQCRAALAWPQSAPPQPWLWGHRAGCLLACQAACELPPPWNLLFWQPTLQGKTVLQQFLRLEAAAALLGKAEESARPAAKSRLAAGQPVEVAGYVVSPELAGGLEAARMEQPTCAQRLEWLDVAPQPDSLPSPAAQTALAAWQQAGWAVRHHAVAGPMFWQTTEIEDAPALVQATLSATLPLASPANAVPAPALGVPA